MALMPSKAAAESVKERRMKFVVGNLQFEMQKILTSCILVEKYPATSLIFNFDIVELDSDLLQSMINCAAIALYKSELECRCIPVAITMLIASGDRKSKKEINWVSIDPSITQIRD